eukprot:TRINITY_DN1931_c0_g1_i4.p3 TRINITY_DN1931_c0_g1~~TRINITY_DN1931_c0_g1_i4.p3  ORF type:complete len:295 (+),score=64.01 TRINITY_DN1931_c0_g1_i4:42-926(+)
MEPRRRLRIEIGTGDGDASVPFHSHPFLPFHTPRELEQLVGEASVVAVKIGNVVCPWSLVDFARFLQFNVVPDPQRKEQLRIESEDASTMTDVIPAPISSARSATVAPAEEYTIALVSATPAVGKTALITQFVNRTFVSDYHPTYEERYRTSVEANRKVVILNIVDTGAQDAFADATLKNLTGCDGYLFVFSMTDPESLSKLNDMVIALQELLRGDKSPTSAVQLPPIVLVANKKDAESKVSMTDAKSFRRQWRMEALVETCAKEFPTVELALQMIVTSIANAKEREKRSARVV